MAKKMPLVIVLDDLHWADKPSLLLLRHLARELSRMRVLIVGTFRDTELARTHPLSEALAELNRESGFQRVVLRGLSREEVLGYIRAAANVEPQRQLVDRIFEETEGNPFFLSEVVNLLTQEGAFSKKSISDIAVPDGVRGALGRRLDLLSEDANELLAIAAIAGREFTYETLSLLGEGEEETVLRLIEEALEARVIEELPQAGRYRFTHALMQETLLAELSTTRRVRIHGQVAEALERRWGERADERATRLAQHFVEAAMLTPRHAEKAMHYSKLAAEQAEAQYGWDEAARHYEDCLTLLGSGDAGPKAEEAELLIALGICARNAGNYRTAWRSLMRAIDLCKETEDARGQARAALQAQMIIAPPERLIPLLRDALESLGDEDPYLEANLAAYLLAPTRASEESEDELEATRQRVSNLIEEHGFDDARAMMISADASRAFRDGRISEGVAMFTEAYAIQSRLGQTRQAANSLWFRSSGTAFRGDIDGSIAATEEGLEYARKHHIRYIEENCAGGIAANLLLRGLFDEFDALAEERAADASFFIPMLMASRLELAGDLEGAVAVLPRPEESGGFPVFLNYIHATRARVFLNAGREEEARAEFEGCVEATRRDPTTRAAFGGAVSGSAATAMDEAFPVLADRSLTEAILESGLQYKEYFQDTGRGARRVLGSAALSLGDVDIAEQCYREALEWSERERCPIEAGRCHYGLAEIAEQRGPVSDALQHLD
jgi:tetratricopeptide (TPR) repeat protein